MKVLVTGGTEFVGAHSVAALVSQGHLPPAKAASGSKPSADT
jgi:uncharacterized protein YbjT (DUF2867 family)